MTALIAGLAVRHDENWTGMAVVAAMCLILSGLAYADTWRHDRRTRRLTPDVEDTITHTAAARSARRAIRVTDLTVHQPCAHNGCDRILCYCLWTDGLPCDGYHHGCWHNHDPRFCNTHAYTDCAACEIEARSGWGMGGAR